jgi:hypothetical protein
VGAGAWGGGWRAASPLAPHLYPGASIACGRFSQPHHATRNAGRPRRDPRHRRRSLRPGAQARGPPQGRGRSRNWCPVAVPPRLIRARDARQIWDPSRAASSSRRKLSVVANMQKETITAVRGAGAQTPNGGPRTACLVARGPLCAHKPPSTGHGADRRRSRQWPRHLALARERAGRAEPRRRRRLCACAGVCARAPVRRRLRCRSPTRRPQPTRTLSNAHAGGRRDLPQDGPEGARPRAPRERELVRGAAVRPPRRRTRPHGAAPGARPRCAPPGARPRAARAGPAPPSRACLPACLPACR